MLSRVAAFAVPLNVSTAKGVLTSDLVRYNAPAGEGLAIDGVMNLTAGTGTTAFNIVCLRNAGPNAGGNVGPASLNVTVAAGQTVNVPYSFLDSAPTPSALPGTPAGAQDVPMNQYVITVAQTGGTAAGTMNYGTISVTPAASGW